MLTIEEFDMIVSDNYADYIQNYYPSFLKMAIKKAEFRTVSDYRWAIEELIDYVYDYVNEICDEPNKSFPILTFIEAVVQFEYDMDLFSRVNDQKRLIFEHAKTIAEDVEDILNAMV